MSQLVNAAAAGNHDKVNNILSRKPKMISSEKAGRALDAAAMGGHLDVIKLLFKSGIDKSYQAYGCPLLERALIYAAENGHVSLVRWLIKEAVRLAETPEFKARMRLYDLTKKALYHAARGGQLSVVRLLTNQSIELTEDITSYTLPYISVPAFAVAAAQGQIDIVRYFIASDIKFYNSATYDALLNAAANQHLTVVQELINSRLEPSVVIQCQTLISAAKKVILKSHTGCFKTLSNFTLSNII
jgi:ankyrin repeat protein